MSTKKSPPDTAPQTVTGEIEELLNNASDIHIISQKVEKVNSLGKRSEVNYNISTIPGELREAAIWVVWKYEPNPDDPQKPKKVPVNPKTGRYAKANTSATWSDINTAVKALTKYPDIEGLGICFSDDIGGVDIDNKKNKPELEEQAQKIIRQFDTYTEYSPSGTGYHLIFKYDRTKLPVNYKNIFYQKNRYNDLECYFSGITNRFFTFTGEAINQFGVEERTEQTLSFLDEYMRRKTAQPEPPQELPVNDNPHNTPNTPSYDVLAVARKARNKKKFIALFDKGDISAYNGDDSAADQALCNILAFYCAKDYNADVYEGDFDKIDFYFRQSALYREDKWGKRADYRAATIGKAIAHLKSKKKWWKPDEAAYRAEKKAETEQQMEQQTGLKKVDLDRYIDGGKLRCPKLDEYFRENFYYIFVRDSAKDTVQRYIYSDGYYKLVSDDEFKTIIKTLIPRDMRKAKDINEVFNLICLDDKFYRRSQINADENIINFKNGVLHLDTMELKPHSPDYLCTKRIPCNYIPDAPPPDTGHFIRYIKHLTAGSKEKASLILQFLGMSISNIKGYRPKKALFMLGEGDTGKSVVRRLAAQLVGEENNSGVTLETLEARFGTSIVYGKRLVGSADMSFMTVKELTAFKQITGGDPIFAEFKGENGFTYEFDGVVWFCMNQLPKFGGDKGDHVYDRMLILECNPNKPEVLDSLLPQKLLTEKEYIVSLAIKELKKVIANGYKYIIPQSCKDAREYYKTQNNSFLQFFEECAEPRPGGKIVDKCTTKRFYDVYKAWCKDNNHGHAITRREVTKLLTDMGKDSRTPIHGTYYWRDFTLTLAAKTDYSYVYGYDTTAKL